MVLYRSMKYSVESMKSATLVALPFANRRAWQGLFQLNWCVSARASEGDKQEKGFGYLVCMTWESVCIIVPVRPMSHG